MTQPAHGGSKILNVSLQEETLCKQIKTANTLFYYLTLFKGA
jgi:hypothetical protein